tara:strand:+ start:5379 stop:5942 length:564 start_codon:yes stop_codon:yes gene_type:complete
VFRKETSEKKIWLTFDDGPSEEVTPFILNILKQENVKATFFLIGKNIDKHPHLLKKILLDGHVIGNHSYSHQNGWFSKTKSYLDDIQKCQALMPENKIFRPPYGKISPSQIRKLNKLYKIILWDVFSWDFSKNINTTKIKETVMNNTKDGSIIVFHNNQKSIRNLKIILQEIIQDLKTKGFLFSTTW